MYISLTFVFCLLFVFNCACENLQFSVRVKASGSTASGEGGRGELGIRFRHATNVDVSSFYSRIKFHSTVYMQP